MISNLSSIEESHRGNSSKGIIGSALIFNTGTVAWGMAKLYVMNSHIFKFSESNSNISLYFYSSIS